MAIDLRLSLRVTAQSHDHSCDRAGFGMQATRPYKPCCLDRHALGSRESSALQMPIPDEQVVCVRGDHSCFRPESEPMSYPPRLVRSSLNDVRPRMSRRPPPHHAGDHAPVVALRGAVCVTTPTSSHTAKGPRSAVAPERLRRSSDLRHTRSPETTKPTAYACPQRSCQLSKTPVLHIPRTNASFVSYSRPRCVHIAHIGNRRATEGDPSSRGTYPPWRTFPRIAFDCAGTSPYPAHTTSCGHWSKADR